MFTKRHLMIFVLTEAVVVLVIGGALMFRNVKMPATGGSASGGLTIDAAGPDMNYDWEVVDVESGSTIPMESYKGAVLVLNLFTADCGPCVRNFPSLQRLEDILSQDELQVLAVSVVPDTGGINAIREGNRIFLPMATADNGVPADIYFDELPVTLVISRTGHIVARVDGSRHWDTHEVLDQMRELLAEPAPG